MNLEELEQEIKAIKERNKRVELDKKWETSCTRRICICILTYIVVITYSYIIRNNDNIFLSSLVPVIRIYVIYFIFKIYQKNLGEKSKIESQCMAFYFLQYNWLNFLYIHNLHNPIIKYNKIVFYERILRKMSSYIIKGGKRLVGETFVSGSKNASLPIMAASILNRGVTKLYNVPNIHDTTVMIEILKAIGCKVKKNQNKIVIDSSNVTKYEIPEDLMHQMRSSVIFAGALLGNYKKAVFSYPGGCDIGARPIDLHIKGFEKLGVKVNQNYGKIECEVTEIVPAEINLDFPSVGATENIMLASVLSKGETTIRNAAMEPEIEDLQSFLNRMGAKISGAGSNVIKIEGVEKLKDVSYNVMPDRIEAGTLLCAAAITGGEVKLKKANPTHIAPLLDKLTEMECKIEIKENEINLMAPKRLKSVDIKTMPYPGFPTDMQAIIAATLSVANGTSVIVENIFENRYKYLNELQKMGAKVKIEGKTAIIKGVKKLSRCKY